MDYPLKVSGLSKHFAGEKVLDSLDLSIRPGELVALVGRSGKGKSVLLKHLVGLLRPDGGQVLVHGVDLLSLSASRLREVRRTFGFVFQDGALLDSLTIYQNVALPLREVDGMPENKIEAAVLEELASVELDDAAGKYPEQVSGGMVRRAALARALVTRPEICLLDEPTTGLDPMTSRAILRHLGRLRKRHRFAGILVTHKVADVFDVVDRVGMLHQGAIIAIDTPEEILNSDNETVKRFFHG